MKEKRRMKVEDDECKREGTEVNGIEGGVKDDECERIWKKMRNH